MRRMAWCLVVLVVAQDALALTKDEARALLKTIDDRWEAPEDYKAKIFLESKKRNKDSLVYTAAVFRRDNDDAFMMLFVAPKSNVGEGYLRLKSNLWFYDPKIGKWDRRTERERIGGTAAHRQDLDKSRLHLEYDPVEIKETRLRNRKVFQLTLAARKGARDVVYPRVVIWVDTESKNILKRQDFVASGKLYRTLYYPKWFKVRSSKRSDMVWAPQVVHIFYEIDGDRTVLKVLHVDLQPLPKNVFTKAWLESKSR